MRLTDSSRTEAVSREQFIRNLYASGLWSRQQCDDGLKQLGPGAEAADGAALAKLFEMAGKLTAYQTKAISEGKFADLVIGNYEVLDRLGVGPMGTVYKGRHRQLKRVVAIKVLPRFSGQSPA